MSTRLSAQDRRQQILQVATGLFARQGFQGTTTRQIADGAQVNEAILFRHFPSKDTLYWTIIEELCSVRGRRERVSAILKSGGDDLGVFTAIAREFLVRTSHDEELTRLLWFTALENHMLSERFFRTYVAVYYEAWPPTFSRGLERVSFGTSIHCLPPADFWVWWFITFWSRNFLVGRNIRNSFLKK